MTSASFVKGAAFGSVTTNIVFHRRTYRQMLRRGIIDDIRFYNRALPQSELDYVRRVED